MKILWISTILFSSLAQATPPFAVETTTPVPKIIKAQHPGVVFKTPANLAPSDQPTLEKRNRYLASIVGEKELGRYDEVDRDLMYYRMNTSTLEKLKQWYPEIPAKSWDVWQKVRP